MFTSHNVLRVKCRMYVTWHTYTLQKILDKVVELVKEGLLSTGPTPSSLAMLPKALQRPEKKLPVTYQTVALV